MSKFVSTKRTIKYSTQQNKEGKNQQSSNATDKNVNKGKTSMRFDEKKVQ